MGERKGGSGRGRGVELDGALGRTLSSDCHMLRHTCVPTHRYSHTHTHTHTHTRTHTHFFFVFVFCFLFFKTGFLCIALAVLELTL
jgi:hypothetical protein